MHRSAADAESELSFLLFTTHFQGKKSRSITFEHSKSTFLKAYISENGLHVPRQQFLPNRIRMIQIKKLEINIGYRPLLSMHKWILTNGSDTVACVPFSMKLDNRRESSGGEQRQDGSLDSYPAPSSFASGEKKKEKRGANQIGGGTVTRSLWAIVRARRCYHSPYKRSD